MEYAIYVLHFLIIITVGGSAGWFIHQMFLGKGLETVEKDSGMRPSERIAWRKRRAFMALIVQAVFGVIVTGISYYFLGLDLNIVGLYFNIASVLGVAGCPLLYWWASTTLRNSLHQKIF